LWLRVENVSNEKNQSQLGALTTATPTYFYHGTASVAHGCWTRNPDPTRSWASSHGKLGSPRAPRANADSRLLLSSVLRDAPCRIQQHPRGRQSNSIAGHREKRSRPIARGTPR
jgi:hypothetical protein